jgi:hypothetical protein
MSSCLNCQLLIIASGQIRIHRDAVPLLCVVVFNDVSCDDIFYLPQNGNIVPRSDGSSMPFALTHTSDLRRSFPVLM